MSCFNLQEPSVEVFGWKVESLGRKVSYDIDSISPPEGHNSLLFDASGETVDNTIVFEFELMILMLSL